MSDIRVRYSSFEYQGFDIHVRSLWDNQQFSDDEGVAEALGISSAAWPIFGVLWASGHTLARIMSVHHVDGLRILEVGCGIGLSSLVLNHRGADITATDRHPSVPGFLNANTTLNGDDDIPFVRAGWDSVDSGLGRFDLIVGADILYDTHQMEDLAAFLLRHCEPGGQVVIVDPGRKQRARFSKRMVAHGFTSTQRAASAEEIAEDQPMAHVLTYDLD